MGITNLIFDWSGTLSNDLQSVYSATMDVFRTKGAELITLEEFRSVFRLPYMSIYTSHGLEISKEEADRCFLEAFETYPSPVIYEGVKETLAKLHTENYSMIVLSSHINEKVCLEAASYGIDQLFTSIHGGVYNKTEEIENILSHNGFTPENTMFIGDMLHDINAGKKAGVTTTAMTWGYQTPEILSEASPDYMINDIRELPELLSDCKSERSE